MKRLTSTSHDDDGVPLFMYKGEKRCHLNCRPLSGCRIYSVGVQ